ncbi:MAG: IclR family transcriptional regulator [Sphaerochaetaceae bacterium]
MEEKDEATGSVPAVDRAVAILEYLTKIKNATIKEISKALAIPSASTARIVKTLASHNFLSEDMGQSATRYSLGLRMLWFSQVVYQQLDITNIAHEFMEELSAKTNQASQLAIYDKGFVTYIEMVLPITPVSIVAPLRSPIAINLSAGGKVLIAGMEDQQRAKVLESIELVHATEKSITDKTEFEAHLEKVRKQGYALDDEEFSRGIGCMAAPVYNYRGEVVAAIGITGQIAVYKKEDSFKTLREAVFKAAQSVSKKLGYNL